MSRSASLFFLLSSIGLLIGSLSFWFIPPPSTEKVIATNLRQLIGKPADVPVYPPAGLPLRLSIPRLGIDSAIEEVGKDAQGRMGVPKDVYQVGWYEPGARPGEVGQAVIDGHINTPQLEPSIFYDLHKLESGDTVLITDSKGTKWYFRIDRVTTYPSDGFPVEQVFGTSRQRKLNLITCSGWWDRDEQDFTQRIVVFTTLERFGSG